MHEGDTDNLILKEMLQSQERFEAGLEIITQWADIYTEIITYLMGQLEKEIQEKSSNANIKIHNDYNESIKGNPHQSYLNFRIRDPQWQSNIWLNLAPEGKWYNKVSFYYGVRCFGSDLLNEETQLAIQKQLGGGKSNSKWPWYIDVTREFSLSDTNILMEAFFDCPEEHSPIMHMADRFIDNFYRLRECLKDT